MIVPEDIIAFSGVLKLSRDGSMLMRATPLNATDIKSLLVSIASSSTGCDVYSAAGEYPGAWGDLVALRAGGHLQVVGRRVWASIDVALQYAD